MKCRKCETENPGDAKFCIECGGPIEFRCPDCNSVTPADGKFCKECGHNLRESKAPQPIDLTQPHSYTPKHLTDKILALRSALAGERKQVTVLFCDLANSTALAARLGPEPMHALLNGFFGLALNEVHRYEGTINQFLGDGFMALFGAPIAHEDHARRAVLAAAGIRRRLGERRGGPGQQDGIELGSRMGIHTGLVIVGAIGDNLRMDYTAVGDTTNVAARLQEAATPGQIVLSEATHRLVVGYCTMRSLGGLSLKGKTEPTRAWAVTSVDEARTRIEVEAERGLTPFVGRERELELLWGGFAQSREGHGQLFFVVGEAGIGKSRLLLEFRRRLGAEVTWLEGRALSFGRSMAFHPLIDLLRRNFRIEEDDSEAAIVEKIEGSVLRLGEEMRSILPHVRYLLSVDPGDPEVQTMDPQLRRAEIRDALRRLLLRAAEVRPQVLVFEDLHWMDEATEAFLMFLADSIPASRVLCLFTYRPGYVHPFGDRTYHTRVALPTLSTEDTVRMAQAMLATERLPQELETLIVQKAEGNPFFVEEVVKSLKEVGAIRRVEDRYELAKPLDEVIVPDTIQDVLMARIDRLEDAPKRTLQLASVIGREFTRRLVDRLADIRDRTEAYLQELKAIELIHEKTLFPELAYMFKHALTQDVAYHSLLEQRRKELHRVIGLAIEELYAERLAEQYEVLGYHFAKGEEWTKALEYLCKAAEKAAQAFATREAIDLYDQALDVAQRLGQEVNTHTLMAIHRAKSVFDKSGPSRKSGEARPDLREIEANSQFYLTKARADLDRFRRFCSRFTTFQTRSKVTLHFVQSDFKRSREEAEALLNLARRAGDRVSESAALARMAEASCWDHDHDRALIDAGQAIEVATEVDAKPALAAGHFTTGFVYAATGRLDWGRAEIGQSLAISQAAGDVAQQSLSLFFAGLMENWQGEFARATCLQTQSVQIAREHRLLSPLLRGLFNHGSTLTGKGDHDRALAALEEGFTLAEKVGAEAQRLRFLNTLGWLHMECGDFERAFDLNQRGAEGARQRGDPETIANVELNLADIFLEQGDFARAKEFFDGVNRLIEDPATNDAMKWRYTTRFFVGLGELCLAEGNFAQAQALADQCLEIAMRTNSRKYLVRGWRLKGEIARAGRQFDEAEEWLRRALTMAGRIGNPTQLWKTHLAVGHLHRDTERPEFARPAYQAARDVVDRVKAGLKDPNLRASLESSSMFRQVYDLSATG